MLAKSFESIHKHKLKTGAFEYGFSQDSDLTDKIKKIDEYVISEIYKINNGLVDVKNVPEYWDKLMGLIHKSFETDIYLCGLATSKYVPKDWLIREAATNKALTYAMFQRDDLTKREVLLLMEHIKPQEMRDFLSDKNSYIDQNNIDILCKLSTTKLRQMQYRCFCKVNEEGNILGNLSKILNDCKYPELLATALIDNPNISRKFKEKIYENCGCVVELLNNPPHFILKDIYPSTAETVFDNTLTDDKTTVQKAIKAMGAFIHNGALSDGMMKDFAYQILSSTEDMKYWNWKSSVSNIIDADTIKTFLDFDTPDIVLSTLRNRNIDTTCLSKLYPYIDKYLADKKEEKQKMFLKAIVDRQESMKGADENEYRQYIHNEDDLAIKTMLISPITPKAIMWEIGSYVATKSPFEMPEQFMELVDAKEALKDATPISQQYLLFKLLEYQIERHPIECPHSDPSFITSKLWRKTLNYLNEDLMRCGGFDTMQTLSKLSSLIDRYRVDDKDTSNLEHLRNFVFGYKEYRALFETKYHILGEEDAKFKLDLDLLSKKYKENPKQFDEDFSKLPIEAKEIFIQELSKEMCFIKDKTYPEIGMETKINILIDMEELFYKTHKEIEKIEEKMVEKLLEEWER